MSVNYHVFGCFPGGEADGEGLHIGQYTAISRFLLRAHEDKDLTSFAAWMEFLRQPHVVIRAEHGVQMTPEEMEATIRERTDSLGRPKQARFNRSRPRPGYFADSEGFEFRLCWFC